MRSRVELFCLVCFGSAAVFSSVPSCSTKTENAPAPDGGGEAGGDVTVLDSKPVPDVIQGDVPMPPAGTFCSLPGSVVWGDGGVYGVVPGGPMGLDSTLTWLGLPSGFCAHYFTTVHAARQVRIAPGGDVFVASPSQSTPGGGSGGLGAIVVLPDDNHDGYADSTLTFLGGLPATQGLLFAKSKLYFQDDQTIRSVPFAPKDRQPSAGAVAVSTVPVQAEADHWSKVIDMAQDGTIYVSNGSGEAETCLSTRPVKGAIFRIEADGSETPMIKGFRNPISMRCETDHNECLVVELERDLSGGEGGREKIVPLHQGDDWGYPCCATKDTPYTGVTYQDTGQPPDCSSIPAESVSFVISHTPFGLDFESGKWPSPWGHRMFVTLHGQVGSWTGARVVGVTLDPNTGLPLPASELDAGQDPNDMLTFATGWDDGTRGHGRPAAVSFAPDGRLFLADDWNGVVAWIAPVGLKP
jgi:glucose/arabinose dehydrogenase